MAHHRTRKALVTASGESLIEEPGARGGPWERLSGLAAATATRSMVTKRETAPTLTA
jgi:hypothetical protein